MTQITRLARQAELSDASPSRLIVLLYDEAIEKLETAVDAMDRGDIELRCHAVNRAYEIVSELLMSLDMEEGGEIAQQLASLYRFILVELPVVNMRNDPTPAQNAIKLLLPVRESWAALDERIEASVAFAEQMDHGIVPAMIAKQSLHQVSRP